MGGITEIATGAPGYSSVLPNTISPLARGAGTRQTVLRILRTRRDPRATPCAQGVGRQIQGQVRPGLG
jgi:hypothetical protein